MKVFLLMLVMFGTSAKAELAQQKAHLLYNRITGTSPVNSDPLYLEMIEDIRSHQGRTGLEYAAMRAIEHKNFYNVVLPKWFKKLSNEEQVNRLPLDDFVASLIGAVRDSDLPSKPFSRVLYDDFVYVGPSLGNRRNNFSWSNNRHYETLEAQGLSYKEVLVEKRQSEAIQTEPDANAEVSTILQNGVNGASGVLTTRQAGLAFYDAGTNRRVTRFAFMNFLCRDFEHLHDTTVPDFRVRRDVDRLAGGDSRTYRNNCVGCHAGQDALGGAFAYYDFVNNRLRYTPGTVAEKMNRDPHFDAGFVTKDDTWINLWAQGQNARLGWRGAVEGKGARELGIMLSASRAFSECMASGAFKLMCVRSATQEDQHIIEELANNFESNNEYNMKKLFVQAASYCVEEQYE